MAPMLERIKDRIRDSSGFMTDKGRLFSYSEWHAFIVEAISTGLFGPYFGAFLLVAAITKEGVTDHLRDMKREVGYSLFGIIAGILVPGPAPITITPDLLLNIIL